MRRALQHLNGPLSHFVPEEACECESESLPHGVVAVSVEDWIEGAAGEHEVELDVVDDPAGLLVILLKDIAEIEWDPRRFGKKLKPTNMQDLKSSVPI